MLHHERQRARGMVHRIGTMADDDPVDPVLYLSFDRLCQRDVLLRAHVLAEDGEQLLRREVADISEFGDRSVQFTRGECRDNRAGTVVEPRSDGPAGAEQHNVWFFWRGRKLLLRNLVMGFLITDSVDLGDRIHVDADVVAGGKLQHEMGIVIVLRARQDYPFELAPCRIDRRLAPYTNVELLQQGQSRSAVPFEYVVHPSPLSIACANLANRMFPRASGRSSPMIQSRQANGRAVVRRLSKASLSLGIRATISSSGTGR